MNSSFTTHAENFGSSLQTQVDPRTGQFTVNFPVATLVGNRQLGPDLSLSLRYSPLNSQDEGFGKGFTLGLTQFNDQTHLLQLMNGEQYRVEPGTDKVLSKKLDNFRLKYTNGYNDSQGYTVIWKEGKIEKLTKSVSGDRFVTTTITSPLGRRLMLSWDWSGQVSRLSEVKDESIVLCSMTYNSSAQKTSMTVWPNTPDAYGIEFYFIDDRLNKVSRKVTNSESLVWNFNYDTINDAGNGFVITGVEYPTGMKDTVKYNGSDLLRMPSQSGQSSGVPAVQTHTRNPGGGQPETVTHYEYTAQNFLGFNSDHGEWTSDSDYLYKTLTDYTYGSTATTITNGHTVATTRTYNNYHLQLSEETSRQGNKHRIEFSYYAKPYYTLEDQPSQFQLPTKKKQIIIDSNNKSRTLTTYTEFDVHGNPIKQVNPDGSEILTSWYSGNGEHGCPADPHGFVRYMKEQTIKPRKLVGSEAIISKTYTYGKLVENGCVVQLSESRHSDGTLLSQRQTEYNRDSKSQEFGRIIETTDTIHDPNTSRQFISKQRFETEIRNGELFQTVHSIGHDDLQTTTTRSQSQHSGRVFSEKTPQGVETRYSYDSLGRLIRRALCPRSDYENASTWEYGIGKNGPYSIEVASNGTKNFTQFDGQGRKIQKKRFEPDIAKWYTTSSSNRNTLNEIDSSSVNDWMLGSNREVPLSAEITYDGWGEKKKVEFSNGLTHHQTKDPIQNVQISYEEGNLEGQRLFSAALTTTHDEFSGLPINQIVGKVNGENYNQTHNSWDGWGQLIQQQDEMGQITKRTYDDYGRVKSHTLADGTVVSRTYAPHSIGNQIASISVRGADANGRGHTWLLGTQEFDSMGRLLKRVSGGRTTTYTYQGACMKPSTVTFPSGKVQTYTYIPELGDAVSSISIDGITQRFTYDKKSGELLKAQEGDREIQYVWSKNGQLKEEMFVHGGKRRKAKHQFTLNKAPTSYTDVSGKKTEYEMNSKGQITTINDDNVTVRLTYDALGRKKTQTVTDNAASSSITTKLNFDDFGQEIGREVTDSGDKTLYISQEWQKNGLLSVRTIKKGRSVDRTERYTYDKRNRLIVFSASGDRLPTDSCGHRIKVETYAYDALNNLTTVETTYGDHSINTATYNYDNASDPTQLTSVFNTHNSYLPSARLEYDSEGRMTKDQDGRRMTYDAMGRLRSVMTIHGRRSTYEYDASNRIISEETNNSKRDLYYRGTELVNEVIPNQSDRRLIKNGHSSLGVSDDSGLTLTATDINGSLLWSKKPDQDGSLHSWSPYGSTHVENHLPAFNGEYMDSDSGTYHLGNGYRDYNPTLMRFNCPDNMSPFGAGGINPYAYCAGDPINNTDPSGHMSIGSMIGIAVATVALVITVGTGIGAIAAAGGLMAAISSASAASLVLGTLGVVSDVTAIASGLMEDSNPEMSATLGWVSLVTGFAGLAAGIAPALRKFETSRAFGEWSVSKIPTFENWAEDVPIRLRGDRDVYWHHVEHNGYTKWGADTTIVGSDIREPLRKLSSRPRNEKIVILTGGHGGRYGKNYMFNHAGDIIRDPHGSMIEHGFYASDFQRYHIDGRTIVVDMYHPSTTYEQLKEYITGDYHVIMGFCYGRNDVALRYELGLRPVISYVKKLHN